MCGIAGIISNQRQIDLGLLQKMKSILIHRGPDDQGVWINKNKTVGLAHCRLSIIDLSRAGHQPMFDNRKEVCITYNGEVYNYLEIRKELEGKGYIFNSNTDTEVILYSYKEWGEGCVKRFNGMFAFAIYDKRNRQVFIARDRVGKKPVYYAQYKGNFIFASELKAITCDPDFSKEINYRALNFYLTYGYIPFELSIFKNVKKLQPANVLIYDMEEGDCTIKRYWTIPSFDNRAYQEEELVEQLECLLVNAVKSRMMSDVPLGAFLSGGLDSSLVVALMSRFSDRAVKTFSIGFEDAKYNELSYARTVSDYFGTEHTELIVKPDAFGILRELIGHFDEPFADSSFIPTYYVSKVTKDYVTVALSGDGGDELFGGYSSYSDMLRNKYFNKLPFVLRNFLSRSAEYLPERLIGKREFMRLKYSYQRAFIDRMSHPYFNERFRRQLLNREILDTIGVEFLVPEDSFCDVVENDRDFINTLCVTDFKTYLPEDILTKVDRMSMKVSLEVRCPLLDYKVVEFAYQRINGNYKVKGVTKKYLLKKLAQNILPRTLGLNRKQGFGIPLRKWLTQFGYSKIEEILLSFDENIINRKFIEQLLKEYNKGVNHSSRIFSLLVYHFWREENL